MGNGSSITVAEQAVETFAATREALLDSLAQLNRQHLDAMVSTSWLAERESPVLNDLADLHRRIVERFLTTHIEVFATTTSALVEAMAVRAAADSEIAHDHEPCELLAGEAVAASIVVSRHEHAGVRSADETQCAADAAPITAFVESGSSADIPLARTSSHLTDRYGSPARLLSLNTERCIDHLLSEWLKSERDEARALIDDATAHAAMARHRAQVSLLEHAAAIAADRLVDSDPEAAGHGGVREIGDASGSAHVEDVVELLTAAVLAELASADPATAARRLASIAEVLDGARRLDDAMFEWSDGNGDDAMAGPVVAPTSSAMRPPDATPASTSRQDDTDFDAAFDAFWNSLPPATRRKMSADRRLGEPLTIVGAPDEVRVVLTSVADAALSPARAAAATPRRRPPSGRRPALGSLATRLASIAGVSAAITLAMVVIG